MLPLDLFCDCNKIVWNKRSHKYMMIIIVHIHIQFHAIWRHCFLKHLHKAVKKFVIIRCSCNLVQRSGKCKILMLFCGNSNKFLCDLIHVRSFAYRIGAVLNCEHEVVVMKKSFEPEMSH